MPVINSGETAVTGLATSFENVPAGITLEVPNAPAEIEAGVQKRITVKVTASPGASGSYSAILKLRDANGFERVMPVNIKTVPAQVIPKLTPQSFEMGMLAGDTRTQSITIENIGFSTWTGVNISTPARDWIKVQGPQQLGDLAPGQNITITLIIQPPAGLSNAAYPEQFSLQSSNYAAVPINAGIVVTSSRKGSVLFNVASADVAISTPPTGRIGGATMRLTSLDIPGLVFSAKTDSNGLARFEELPSGRYNYRAEATGYNPMTGQLTIEPGLTQTLDVFLPTTMVSYKWSVTPTTIQDKYDITLDMTFRTDVRAPALIVDPPSLNFIMEAGQTLYTQFTIKNKGLVSAFNVKLADENTDPAVKLEYAFTEIAEIKAGETITVPVKITLLHASCHVVSIGIKYMYFCIFGISFSVPLPGVTITVGSFLGCGAGGGGSITGPLGIWDNGGRGGSGTTGFAPKAVINAATVKTCSGAIPHLPEYKHRPPAPPFQCPESVGGINTSNGSLEIDWRLYYDSLLMGFYETTGWALEEQSDGSVILTDDEGNQVLFVAKGPMNSELIGPCEQYKDVPGYNALVSYAYGKYTVVQKGGNTIEYTKHGDKWLPDLIKDTNNTTLSYAYDEAQRVQSITDIHGRSVSFAYDSQGRKTRVSDFAGRQLSLAYDNYGRLSALTNIDGSVNTYNYGDDGRMSAINYASGAHKYMVYDSTGRLVSSSEDNDNNKLTYEYNDISSATKVTDALGRESIYGYMEQSGRSEITKITGPDGAATSYEYNYSFNRTKVKDALNRETRMTYSGYGNLLSVTDPLGNTTVMRYGIGSAADGNPWAISNTWALRHIVSRRTCPEFEGDYISEAETNLMHLYDLGQDAPNLTEVTDPKGNTTAMDYDLNGNMTEVKDTLGNKTQMSYDSMGHVTGTKDPLGHVSLLEYDNYGALVKVTDPLGRVTEMTRDNLSRVTQTKDPKDKLTLFEYDVLSNLTKVSDAIGGVTEYSYTKGGCTNCGGTGSLLASVKDAKNQTTTFNYDLQKRLTEVKNPLEQKKNFTYDKKGNLTGVTDAKGQTISFDYDVMDRLTVKHLPEGDVTYTYDVVGNLLSVTSPEGQLTFAYDALSRVTQTTQRFPIYASPYTLSYAYDANGNRTGMTSPWGATTYTYDALNRLISLTNPDNKTVTFAYDAAGKRTRMTYPNGTETTYAYDAASQLTQILHRKTADNTAIAFANYNYDPAGNRTSMQDLTGTHSYGYDDLHRLITADHPAQSNLVVKNEVFNYDAVGNRLSDAVMTNYQHNAANRLLENSSYTYTYDANGNMTGQTEKANNAHTTYEYNSENQMKQATMSDGTIVTTKYDPQGRRIEKTVQHPIQSPIIIRYIYDTEDIIATLDANNTLTANFTHSLGIDEPLIMKKADTTANYYYHVDGLGSIIALTDANGAMVETVEYQVYGKPLIKDNTGAVFDKSTVGNHYLFTAREFDDETGLIYLRHRYYDLITGTFLQEDPIRFKGGINLYSYALNNPILLIDPYGLAPAPFQCQALKDLIAIDDKKGASGVVWSWEFNASGFGGGPQSLHYPFESIAGPIQLDWMLRTAAFGLAYDPFISQALFYGVKPIWNMTGGAYVYNAPRDPRRNMTKPEYANAPTMATIWLWSGIPLRQLFAPAIKECSTVLKECPF